MRAAGKMDEEIAAELKTAGWVEADIASGLGIADSAAVQNTVQSLPETQTEVKPVRNKRLGWIILFSSIVLLTGIYTLLRILPFALGNALRKQGTLIEETVVAPTQAPNPEQKYISFPSEIITFQIPPTWYQKKKSQSEESYALHFAQVGLAEEDESGPPLTMEITMTYASRELPSSLTEIADMARKSFLETQLPGVISVYTILKEQSTLVDGIPAYQFDYKVDINKRVTVREKNPDSSWSESTSFVTRIDRGRQVIFLDSRKNLFAVTFPALEAEWDQYESDFIKVIESMKIKYK
jgi:hypothetical protein